MQDIGLAMMITMMASATQGVAGFGGGLISMSLLSMLWPVPFATAVLCPLGIMRNLTVMWRLKDHLKPKLILPILIGLPFGVALGIMSLELLSEVILKAVLGVALLATVLNAVLGRSLREPPRALGPLVGILSGATGAALSSPGPPAIIYATLCGWPRDTFRAQLSIIFGAASAMSLIGFALRGVLTFETLTASAYLLPGLIFSSALGVKLGGRLPQTRFRRLVLCLLTALAARFLWNVL